LWISAVLTNITGPDGKTVLEGVSITLLGADSTAANTRMATENRRQNVKNVMAQTMSEVERKTIDRLVALTTSWSGIDMDGKPFPCKPENVRSIYENPGYRWLRDQVAAFIDEPSNFFVNAGNS